MTVRWVVAHLMELPDSSRIKKHCADDKAVFDLKDHLIADVRDLLLVNNYFTAVAAMKEMKSSQQQKIARGMPKRPPRPGDEKEKPRMATSEELKMLFPPKAAARRIRQLQQRRDRKSTRLNSSHVKISYAVFCLKKKKT